MRTSEILDIAYDIEQSLKYISAIKTMTVQQEQAVRRLDSKLKELFDGVINNVFDKFDVLDRLPANSTQRQQLLTIFGQIEDEYNEIIIEEAIETARIGKNQTIYHLLQAGVSVDEAFEFSDHVHDLIEQHVFEASEQTLDRMKGDVMETLTKAYDEGVGIDEASEMLEDKFDSMQDYELERIARTEIIGHQTEGSYMTMEEFDINYHQWWSAEDDDVRDSHDDIHGEIVRVGDEFSNGLKYPGDRDGPIEEWINCRCGVVPFIVPDDKKVPTGKTRFYEDDLVAA